MTVLCNLLFFSPSVVKIPMAKKHPAIIKRWNKTRPGFLGDFTVSESTKCDMTYSILQNVIIKSRLH